MIFSGSLHFIYVQRPHLLEEEDPFHTEVAHKPLTPLEQPDFDPFDTSIAEGVVPGKTELKVLEQELQLGVDSTSGRRLSDPDFDPRGSSAPQPVHPAALSFVSKTLEPVKVGEKVLPPSDDTDPFDTSTVPNVTSSPQPIESENTNKPDLKALEAELL